MIHTALSFVIPLKRVSKTLVYWTGSSLSSSCPSGLSLTYLLPFKTFTDIAFASPYSSFHVPRIFPLHSESVIPLTFTPHFTLLYPQCRHRSPSINH